MNRIIIGCCLCLLLGCGKKEPAVEVSTPVPVAETRRDVSGGAVIGFRDGENTFAWLGIPYAKAPVGELRWKAPRAPEAWSGVREALRFNNMCPQLGGIASNASVELTGQLVGSEDCLYLNVWSPQSALADNKRMPVMVWIHGGGNTLGTANTYDFARVLAGRQQVVVVTLNYRLGIFGWFSHPALAERADEANAELAAADKSGNFGTLDIIQSLHWVRDNIAAFGGDPANVTVFGESAGGFNVYSLLASPLAKGLFAKAISQSGGVRMATVESAQNFADETPAGHTASAKELTLALLQADKLAANRSEAKAYLATRSAAEITAYLQGKTPEQLFAVLSSNAERLGLIELPMVFTDGHVLPKVEPQVLLSDATLLQRVPLITGTNRDEMKLFQANDPHFVGKWFGLIPRIRDKTDYDRSARYGSELWRITGADLPATTLTQAGSEPPVFVYRYDFDQLKDNWLVSLSELLGAGHGLEMTYVFGLEDSPVEIFKVNPESTLPARQRIAYAMSSYWTNFAYTGTPGRGRNGDLPEWKAWSNEAGSAKTLLIDADNRGGIRHLNEALTIATLKQQLLTDPSFKDDRDALCRTYTNLFLRGMAGDWFFDAHEYASLGGGECPPVSAPMSLR